VFPSLVDINQILGSPECERTKRIKRREVSCYVIHSALLVLFMHKTLNNLSYMRINLNIVYWPVPCNGLKRKNKQMHNWWQTSKQKQAAVRN
jgi:hypothetical protein